MKKLKFLAFLFGLLSIALVTIFVIVRTPSYSIQTNGKLYIVNKLSKSISVFDLSQGHTIEEFFVDIEPHEATTLPGSNKVVITNYGAPDMIGRSISVINTTSNKIEKTIELQESLRPHGIISFPEANRVGVVTDVGNDLIVVDTENGIVEKKIPTQQIVSHLLVLHPLKPLAFVTNINSGSVSVIDLEVNQVVKIIPCGVGTEGIDITPDGSEVWVTNNKDETISVINANSFQITHTLATGVESLRLKFSIDGKFCFVPNSGDGTISVYDQLSKELIKTIRIPGKKTLIERAFYHTPRPVGILMHPNGLYAFIANSNADRVEVIDMKSFDIVSTIGTGRIPDGLAFIN